MSKILRFPYGGEPFELTVNGQKVTPEKMLVGDRIDPASWQFYGSGFTGIKTSKFKLIQIGNQDSFDRVVHNLHEFEDGWGPADAQFREAFRRKFRPRSTDKYYRIGFAGSKWLNYKSREHIACLWHDTPLSNWGSDFYEVNNGGEDFPNYRWWWLLEKAT
jgi:hypothetical protein